MADIYQVGQRVSFLAPNGSTIWGTIVETPINGATKVDDGKTTHSVQTHEIIPTRTPGRKVGGAVPKKRLDRRG